MTIILTLVQDNRRRPRVLALVLLAHIAASLGTDSLRARHQSLATSPPALQFHYYRSSRVQWQRKKGTISAQMGVRLRLDTGKRVGKGKGTDA